YKSKIDGCKECESKRSRAAKEMVTATLDLSILISSIMKEAEFSDSFTFSKKENLNASIFSVCKKLNIDIPKSFSNECSEEPKKKKNIEDEIKDSIESVIKKLGIDGSPEVIAIKANDKSAKILTDMLQAIIKKQKMEISNEDYCRKIRSRKRNSVLP
ncbi:MAG: hypothetical protein J7L15_00585, partial [Clostridiales bacterium]|nr:hypothetical protein [Clostridiales bacterium]